MLYVHLHHLRFFGHHGVFEEERILGNEYELNLTVGFEPKVVPVTQLEETIDYTRLYELVKRRMHQPTPLLETIATELVAEIRSMDNRISRISVSIQKLYPPVNSFEGRVGVSFEWTK